MEQQGLPNNGQTTAQVTNVTLAIYKLMQAFGNFILSGSRGVRCKIEGLTKTKNC